MGIKGNTLADAAATAAHTAPISPMSIPYSDTKHAVSTYIKSLRQEKWNNETHNKLHNFQPLIGITPLSGVYCRQDETVLQRCRIGHTLYTHSARLPTVPASLIFMSGSLIIHKYRMWSYKDFK